VKSMLVLMAIVVGCGGSVAKADDGLCIQRKYALESLVRRHTDLIRHNNYWISFYTYAMDESSAQSLLRINEMKFAEISAATAQFESLCP
jgi:hypothetical protein